MVVGAVVFTVSVEVAAFPLTETEAGFRLQVGASIAPVGLEVIAQVRATVPLNPEEAGVTVIVEVFPVVAPAAILMPVPLRV